MQCVFAWTARTMVSDVVICQEHAMLTRILLTLMFLMAEHRTEVGKSLAPKCDGLPAPRLLLHALSNHGLPTTDNLGLDGLHG